MRSTPARLICFIHLLQLYFVFNIFQCISKSMISLGNESLIGWAFSNTKLPAKLTAHLYTTRYDWTINIIGYNKGTQY